MCGIVGCVGHECAVSFVADGLEALEYRGYDSMGIALVGADQSPDIWTPRFRVVKTLGGISGIRQALVEQDQSATTAIGHTRWATHGGVTIANAHPHTNTDKTIAVVHNGTIDNHVDLRTELEAAGYAFTSETDTEVVPHLIDFYTRQKGQEAGAAFTSAIKRLSGAYAILASVIDQPDTIFAARRGGPLVLGVNGSEHFAASDPSVLKSRTKKAIYLEDNEIAELGPRGHKIWNIKGAETTRDPEELTEVYEIASLGEFPNFMLKEIHETPETVRAAISGRVFPDQNLIKLGGLEDNIETRERLRQVERLVIIACGTSYHAGLIGERLIEEVAGVPVEVQLASEFLYRNEPFDRETAILAISQSGETVDTIGAIQKAKGQGILALGVNNSPGSTIDRITDAGVHCRAKKEVSVASTKAFISQITVLSEIALALGQKTNEHRKPLMDELHALPAKIERVLANSAAIELTAKKYANSKNFLYIGRGYDYPSALEGALKLKEISYIHAEGIGAGEMKHGTIALIDEDFPTFAIATDGSVYEKTVSNIQEIKARNGPVIALATEGNEAISDIVDDVIYVPRSLEMTQPILNAVAMQLFAYYVAVEKGLNVDRPRNLAKSVTVE